MPRILPTVMLTSLLAACVGGGADPRGAPASGGYQPPSHARALQEAYGAMAAQEARAGSAEDVAFFQDRMAAAGSGVAPAPLAPSNADVAEARRALLRALERSAELPGKAATAQAAYDCWARDTERGTVPEPVDCRALLTDTLRDLIAPE